MIIEHAFVTSKTDSANFLDNEAKLKAMGQADAKAIAKYFGLDVMAAYPSNVEFAAKNTSVNMGSTITLTPVFTPESVSKDTLTYKSSNTSVATVSSKGIVKGVSEGQAIITATTVNGHVAYCKVTVKKAATKLTISNAKLTVNVGTNNKKMLSSWMEPSVITDTKLTYKSDDTSIAKVDAYGVITGVSEGKTTISVTNANNITVKCSVTVTYYTTKINMKRSVVKVSKGYTADVTEFFGTSVTPSGSVEDWELISSNGAVVAMQDGTTFKAMENGCSVITMKTASGCVNYGLIIVEDGITGYKDVTSTQNKEIYTGAKVQLSDWNKAEITKLETEAVAISDGVLEAEKPGYAWIQMGETDYLVKVKQPQVTNIEVPSSEITMTAGSKHTIQPKITANPGTDVTLKWTSSNQNVATVDQNGVVTAVGNGDAKIYIDSKADGCGKKLGVIVHVTTKETGIKLCTDKLSIPAGQTKYLTATFTPSNASNQSISWSSSNVKVASVASDGKVSGLKKGTAVITAKSANGFISTCKVTVTPKITSISVAKKVGSNQSTIYLKKGKSTKIVWTVKPASASQSVYRISTNSSVASISSKGVIKAKKKGSTTIALISKDGTVQKKIKVNVVTSTKKATAVKLASKKLTVKVKETVQLKASITPKSTTGNVSYQSGNKSVATVDAYGRVKGIKKGTANITVKATGGKKATCKVTVK